MSTNRLAQIEQTKYTNIAQSHHQRSVKRTPQFSTEQNEL